MNQARHYGNNLNLRKIVFKTSSATIILFKDLKPDEALVRVEALKRIYTDWRGQFVIIR